MTLAHRLTVAMIGVALTTAIIIALVVGQRIRLTIEPIELERQRAVVHGKILEFTSYTDGVVADVLALRKSLPASSFVSVDDPSAESLDTIAQLFRARIETKPAYLQVRLISVAGDGQELVRIERPRYGGPVSLVSRHDLQPKGHRYYLSEAAAMGEGEVFVSPIDLNREHGRIQQPHVAVMRAATPVIGNDGKVIAVVVINVDVGPLLYAMTGTSDQIQTYLINRKGDFLVHPNRDHRFASDLGHGHTFAVDFADLAGHVSLNEGWTAERRTPAGEIVTMVAETFMPVPDYRFTLINAVPSLGAAATSEARRIILWSSIAGVAVALFVALLLGRRLSKPIRQMAESVAALESGEVPELPEREPGEIGVLARALHSTSARLQQNTQALRAEERRFRTLFEESPSALVLVNADRQITMLNTQAERLFGYPRDELLNQPVDILVPHRLRHAHAKHTVAYFNDPASRTMGEDLDLFGLRKDGTEVPIAVGLAPLETSAGLQTLAAIADISQRRQFENRLRRSNDELAQFAYVAAHDLREPLRIVSSYSELLARRYKSSLDERAGTYLSYMVSEAKRMQSLITDLLAYSKVEAHGRPPEPISTQRELQAVLKTLQPLIERESATITTGELPDVMADANQFRMLMQNLLNNAIAYRSERPPEILISAKSDRGMVEFAVKDNGLGISSEFAERVFQMFQRLGRKDEESGSGIGLALVKRIVERHDGRIWFESEVGVGTTFFFTLHPAQR